MSIWKKGKLNLLIDMKKVSIRLNKVKEIEKKREKIKMLFLEDLISEQEMKSDFKTNEQINKLKEELKTFENKLNLENKKENTKKEWIKLLNLFKMY